MQERKRSRRIVVFAAAAIAMLAGADGVAAQCAQYMSSGPSQTAFSGYLAGETEVVLSIGYGSVFMTESFSVGKYRADDGTTIRVRCDTLQPWVLD